MPTGLNTIMKCIVLQTMLYLLGFGFKCLFRTQLSHWHSSIGYLDTANDYKTGQTKQKASRNNSCGIETVLKSTFCIIHMMTFRLEAELPMETKANKKVTAGCQK